MGNEASDLVQYWRLFLYAAQLIIMLLAGKLLLTKHRGDKGIRLLHPLTDNAPMYLGIVLLILSTLITRARNIESSAPPNYFQLVIVTIGTLLIIVWLWKNLEILPAWLRSHSRFRARRASRGGRHGNAARRGQGDARA